jgi:hypothetical protein
MNSREVQELKELYSEVYEERAAKRRKPSKSVEQLKAEIDAKNPTEEGITGKQIPKKKWRSAPKRHEFEKERRAERKKREGSTGYGHSGHLMTGSTRTMAHNRHDTIGEAKVDDLKYGKGEKESSRNAYLSKNLPNVRTDRNKRFDSTAGKLVTHSEVEGKRLSKHFSNRGVKKEEFDIFDFIFEYLVTEGYADTEQAAEAIMMNMSEEWVESIVEEVLDERKYDRDEKLPGSGKTPREKMERQRGKHGANYLLRGRETKDRNDQARTSHFNRATTMDTVKAAQDAGEEPSKDPKWKNTIAARRRPRASYEVPNERPGGLRAGNTKAGGHRTLKRKED